jgi:hypothetical protein
MGSAGRDVVKIGRERPAVPGCGAIMRARARQSSTFTRVPEVELTENRQGQTTSIDHINC